MPLGRFDLGFPNRAGSDSTCWLGWRPAWMGKPYSMDLRERVVAAVETGGLSCHQAAAQFGVGVSTAIVWVRRLRENSRTRRARPQGRLSGGLELRSCREAELQKKPWWPANAIVPTSRTGGRSGASIK